MKAKNFLKLKTNPLFKAKYVYFDTIENDKYLADQIFINNDLNVKFGKEFAKDNERFIIIAAKVSKKDTEKFEKCMEELYDKMILMGYEEYPEFCESTMKMLGH